MNWNFGLNSDTEHLMQLKAIALCEHSSKIPKCSKTLLERVILFALWKVILHIQSSPPYRAASSSLSVPLNGLWPSSINILALFLEGNSIYFFILISKQEQLHLWLLPKQRRNRFLWPHSRWEALCDAVLRHRPVPRVQLPQWAAPDLTARGATLFLLGGFCQHTRSSGHTLQQKPGPFLLQWTQDW